jgi:ubiquinone/menaquinone biosynthesis C-methylase UbiE
MTDLEVARIMAAYKVSPEEQLRQIKFRRQLVEWWGIQPGQRILEIGCGQGDMTAVLADAVGPAGYVLAVDSADESYGSPVSLGDSAAAIKNSVLGPAIEFRYNFSDYESLGPDSDFDLVVLANSSWYFTNADQLRDLLKTVRYLVPKLLFSEWDANPLHLSQLGHFLSVQFAQLCSAHYADAGLNIRNALSKDAIKELMRSAGWHPTSETLFNQPELSDGKWEIQMCLEAAARPGADQRLLPIVEAIRANQHHTEALPIFAVVATLS